MISNKKNQNPEIDILSPVFMEMTNDLLIVLELDNLYEVDIVKDGKFLKKLGYLQDELVGNSFLSIINPKDEKKVRDLLEEKIPANDQSDEIRLKTTNDDILWARFISNRFLDQSGKSKILVQLSDISKQKNLEFKLETLGDSEEKFRRVYENANDLIRVFNDKFEYEYLNEHVHKRVLGYSKDDLIGKTQLNLYHPKDRKKAILLLSKILRKGKGSYQARFKEKGGNYKWFEFSPKNFINSKGEKKILSIARDITERKIAELKLKESEEKYRDMAELLPDIVFETDKNLDLTYVNSVAFKRFGYTPDDLRSGLNIASFLHPKYKEKAFIHIKSLFEGKKTKPNDYLLCKRDGSCFYARIHSRPVLKDNQVVGIRGTITDINEMVIAEKELKESEEKYRLITENSQDIVYTLDMNLNNTYISPSVSNLLGYDVKEAILMQPKDTVHKDDLEKIAQIYKEEFQLEGNINIEKDFNRKRVFILREKHKDGNILFMEHTISWLRDENGVAVGILGVARDITEKIYTEKLLKESEEKYRSLFENMNVGFAYHEVILDNFNQPFDYKYLEINPKFEETTGLKKEDLIGKNVTEVIPGTENDPADWIGKFGNVGITGIPLTVEDYSEGIDKWFQVSGYSPKKGFFAVTFNDITDRKKAEQRLKESEEKYRSLFENSPIALMDQDFSELKRSVDDLKASGIDDFGMYFDNNPEEFLNFINKTKIVDVNKKTLEVYRANSKEDFILKMHQLSDGKEIEMTEEVILDNRKEMIAL
ncbi:MAG: PAS domain S-box protein, partial [Promethearchaeota archaeon]